MGNHYIGIDIGGTKILIALMTENGRIIDRIKQPTPKAAGLKKIATLIAQTIKDLCAKAGLNPRTLKGIGVGYPGIIDPLDNRILGAPNVSFIGTSLARELHAKTGLKMKIGNDVNCGILGEQWLGSAKGLRQVVGIFLGTGIGGGVICDDHLLHGYKGGAGELGHMIVDINGPKCTCGNQGCLEAFAGRWAIERDIRAALAKGEKSIISKWLENKNSPIKSKLLKKALKREDQLTEMILEKAARAVGQACISIRHLYSPQAIVLGGGLIEACGDFLMPHIESVFKEDQFFKKLGGCRLLRSKLGDDAVLVGSVRQLLTAK